MNIFQKILNPLIKSNAIKIDNEDLNKIFSIENIKIQKCVSKQGKINKKQYYRWFGTYNNIQYSLNLSRKNLLNLKVKIYCKFCNKFLSYVNLSNLFNLKFTNFNTITLNYNLSISCKQCATKHNSLDNQEKSKQTCLKKYGVEYSFQSQNNKQKSIQTKIKKYGKDWKKIQASTMRNYIDKNGIFRRHNGDDPIIRAKMIEKWKQTVSNKSIDDIIKWRNSIIGNTISKKSKQFFEDLEKYINFNIIKQFPVLTYHVDGLIQNKCVIQFFGDYWHANPIIYNKTDILCYHKNNILVQQVWIKDKNRLQKIKQKLNLPIIIVWENDYIKHKDQVLQKIKIFLQKGIQNNVEIYYI